MKNNQAFDTILYIGLGLLIAGAILITFGAWPVLNW